MTNKQLRDFFENEEFIVMPFKQDGKRCAEIEKWTNGGVDMNILLMPFTVKEFKDYVENIYDVDDEIDLHRQGKNYRKTFRISESVKDFTDFHDHLKEVAAKLK